MNKSALILIAASLGATLVAGTAQASPQFYEDTWLAARERDEAERKEQRDVRRFKQHSEKQKQEQAGNQQEDRGYGYGYERRNPERFDGPRGRR